MIENIKPPEYGDEQNKQEGWGKKQISRRKFLGILGGVGIVAAFPPLLKESFQRQKGITQEEELELLRVALWGDSPSQEDTGEKELERLKKKLAKSFAVIMVEREGKISTEKEKMMTYGSGMIIGIQEINGKRYALFATDNHVVKNVNEKIDKVSISTISGEFITEILWNDPLGAFAIRSFRVPDNANLSPVTLGDSRENPRKTIVYSFCPFRVCKKLFSHGKIMKKNTTRLIFSAGNHGRMVSGLLEIKSDNIFPGASGGPIWNKRGEVVGYITSGSSGSGVASAHPIEYLKRPIGDAIKMFRRKHGVSQE